MTQLPSFEPSRAQASRSTWATPVRALAVEVGIEVTKDPRIGWSPTSPPTGTRQARAGVIAELSRALRLRRAAELTGSEGRAAGAAGVRVRAADPGRPVGARRRLGFLAFRSAIAELDPKATPAM